MTEKNTKTRIGFYIENDLLRQCDNSLKDANASSRNEFVNNAIRFYLGYISEKNHSLFLSKSMVSVMRGMMDDTENRMATLLFKLTVEMSIMMNVIAAIADIDEETMRKLRIKCVDYAKRTNGSISLAQVAKMQREGE